MSTFQLPNMSAEVPVYLSQDLSKEQLLGFPAFKTWINTLQHSLSTQQAKSHTFYSAPYKLRAISIQSVDFFGGGRIGFIKLKAEVSNDNGEKLPGSVFLRGGSVGMLVCICTRQANCLLYIVDSAPDRQIAYSIQLTLQPDDVTLGSETEKYVILTLQPRIPVGSLSLPELPAGMLDEAGTFSGGAAKEIAEETGLAVSADDLLNLTDLALQEPSQDSSDAEEHLQKAVYPS